MLKQFAKELYQIWITERPSQLAAALAFASMFSFAPVIFIALNVVGFFADKIQFGNQVYQRLQGMLGEEVASLIQESITALSKPSSGESILVSIISFVALILAASSVFLQLQYALNAIWLVPLRQQVKTLSFIRKQLVSFVLVIGIGLIGILAVFTNLLLAWFGSFLEKLLRIDANLSLAAGVASWVVVVITFALFYKFLPETKIAWGDVWLGAGVAALLIQVAANLAGFYFQHSSLNSALQVAGGFSVLLLGFYYAAQIFLLGAVICRVYANLLGSRRSSPAQMPP